MASVPLVTSQMADYFFFYFFLPNKTKHVSRRGRSQYLAVGEDKCDIVALCDITREHYFEKWREQEQFKDCILYFPGYAHMLAVAAKHRSSE